MKFLLGIACFLLVPLVGCGGHEGGKIEIEEGNPYQITAEEQEKADSLATGYADDAKAKK